MATSLNELIVTFQANSRPVVTALNKVDAKLQHTVKFLSSTSESFTRLGRELGLIVSLPLLGLGGASLKAAADIQSLEASLTSVLSKFETGLPIEQAVSDEMEYLKKITDELGVSFSASIKPYTRYLAASKDSLETNRKVMKSFLGLSSGLGLTTNDLDRVIRALEQMQSKGRVMSEELKLQLGDAVPGAVGLFAEAIGVSTEQLFKMMEQGEVTSDVLSKVADTIDKKYGAAIDKGSKTIRANANKIGNAFFMLRKNVGLGMDETFKINDKMEGFAAWLIKVSDNFARLDESGKSVILTIGTFLAVIGPLLLVLGTMGKVFRLAASGLKLLIGPIVAIAVQFGRFSAILAANPLGLFIASTISIIVYWKEIVSLFDKAFQWLSKISFDWLSKISFGGILKKFQESPENSKSLVEGMGSSISGAVGAFNNFLAQRDLLPDSFLSGGRNNSPANNQKTVNNNLTVNIPAGMSGADSASIKGAIKQALAEENRQTYIELGIQ